MSKIVLVKRNSKKRNKRRDLDRFFSFAALKVRQKHVFLLIPSKNTIKKSADILIAFKNSLIVFLISQGENKICSIENNFPPIEIENTSIVVMTEDAIFSFTDLRTEF